MFKTIKHNKKTYSYHTFIDMASCNRNPKELKDIIEKSKPTNLLEEMPQAAQPSQTEIELLNSKIEEQTQLIIFYKVVYLI